MHEDRVHIPVLLNEVIEHLDPKAKDIILDATLGCAGHASQIIERIKPSGMLIGIDQDIEVIKIAQQNLSGLDSKLFKIVKNNFRYVDKVLDSLEIKKLNGAMFDIGISSFQIDTALRGFSIKEEGPLDMRMDLSQKLTAYDVVNKYPEKDLADVIYEYGEERRSRKIARYIKEARHKKRIETTKELADLVLRALKTGKGFNRVHPATKTFQAIRIEVNAELTAIKEALEKIVNYLDSGARVCVISFHSLEDRIVKNFFRDKAKEDKLSVITKKPITASDEELKVNKRSRSAKLRVAQKI